jgi:hypothetical protein
MKFSCFALFVAVAAISEGQTSYKYYTDRTNSYSIYIPSDWKYTITKNYSTIKLFAYYAPENSSDRIRDNFNINIFKSKAKNLDDAYSIVLKSIQSAKRFALIDSGKIMINGKQFRWLIENHENLVAKITMSNYVFVTLSGDRIYILTMVSLAANFLKSKELFNELATSLDIKG